MDEGLIPWELAVAIVVLLPIILSGVIAAWDEWRWLSYRRAMLTWQNERRRGVNRGN